MDSDTQYCFLCGKPCSTPCPDCSDVFYCSQEHLDVHRSQGRCLPWKVERQEGVGRIVVATRDIEPWELVMKDTALAVVREREDFCVSCGSVLPGRHYFKYYKRNLKLSTIFYFWFEI